jgi:hypothetical protein
VEKLGIQGEKAAGLSRQVWLALAGFGGLFTGYSLPCQSWQAAYLSRMSVKLLLHCQVLFCTGFCFSAVTVVLVIVGAG